MNEQQPRCPCASFSLLTHVAIVLGALFILFMFFETTTIRWWLMLPLAGLSLWLFHIQSGQTTDFEWRVCRWGFWIVAIAAVARDMCLSGQLATLYERMLGAGLALHI